MGCGLWVVGCGLLVYLWDKLMVGFAFQPTTNNQQPITNIHKPNLCLVAYGRYAHNKARTSDNAQQQSASNDVPIFYSVFIVLLYYLLCQTIHHPHEADIHIRYR